MIKRATYVQIVLGALATYYLTWWALLIFSVIFLVLKSYTKEDLKKPQWKKLIKFWAYLAFSCVQIFYLLTFLIVNWFVMAAVNITQVLFMLYLKNQIKSYETFLNIHQPAGPATENQSQDKKFFTKDLLVNLGDLKSKCEKK